MRTASDSRALLEVDDLHVGFPTSKGVVNAVRGVSFAVREGEIVAIVGESGSGKSATARSLLALTRHEGAKLSGSVTFASEEILNAPYRRLRELRGREISIVFQDPLSSLNPVQRIGDQIAEQLRAHERLSRRDAIEAAESALHSAGMPQRTSWLRRYPSELSGGERQRVVIAMAVCLQPRLLVADEPTSALDVSTQAQILAELARLRSERGTSIVLVTHDLAIVADLADRVLVMHDGRIVESASSAQLIAHPQHPMSRRLLSAFAGLMHEGGRRSRPADEAGGGRPSGASASRRTVGSPVLRLQRVSFEYEAGLHLRAAKTASTAALKQVSLEVREGETLGIVGESGCGKTTLIRCAAGLVSPSSGEILFEGAEMTAGRRRQLRRLRRGMQVVFQDPMASLNPRRTVTEVLARPLRMSGVRRDELRAQIIRLLEEVGLSADHRLRLPHELSGGERQRVGIARALALNPRLLLLDEPVSALDASVRMQILTLLRDLRSSRDLSCIFVAHDLALVATVSDTIAVMHEGEIVEQGRSEQIWCAPSHPHTQALLAAVPRMERSIASSELTSVHARAKA